MSTNGDPKENAARLESEIQALSQGHWDWFERDSASFWNHARQVSSLFKTVKPVARADHERLWGRFNQICEEAKRNQQEAWDERKRKSEQHRSNIIHDAESARPCSLFGFAPPNVEEIKALGRLLRDAGRLLSKHKAEMLGEHKQECFQRLQEIRQIHDAWWEDLKRHRTRKHGDFQARVRANLEKNHERHRKAAHALERARRHADDLRDKIASAWSDDYRDRAYTWLSEAEERIRDIEDSLREIEEWIREDQEKIR